jgi:hypothetical protein
MSTCPIVNPFNNLIKLNGKLKNKIPYVKKTIILVGTSILIHNKQKLYYRSCGGTYG